MPLAVRKTPIPGVLILDLPVQGDNRGWFKENWQREKMIGLGLPDFKPVQHNISFNQETGTTRGIHAEPWDKFISVAAGRVFGAWVDLREGDTFGTVFTTELDPSNAIFIPRGVGNAFQSLEPNTAYSYLVNSHWSRSAQSSYTFLNLADESANIDWPIALDQAVISDKDREHPRLANVTPMPPKKTLIIGAKGQIGMALRKAFPISEAVGRSEFDLTEPESFSSRDWSLYSTIINAAAYTLVDEAETEEGRKDAWAVNVVAVAQLARIANEHNITLVHISSDYVFDGTAAEHSEDEEFSPLGVYGQTKAAGDAVVSTVASHYIIRTSWVIGDGHNFVRTMERLARNGSPVNVVNDQFGRLAFTDDIAQGIATLLESRSPFGTYNLTSSGDVLSWFDVAQSVYQHAGADPNLVTGILTSEYASGRAMAPRPRRSALELSKAAAAGIRTTSSLNRLAEFLSEK